MQEKILLPGELGVSPSLFQNPPRLGVRGLTMCHPEGTMRPKDLVEILHRVYTERSECVQNDRCEVSFRGRTGVLGVSPNFSLFPHEWGIEGVDKS